MTTRFQHALTLACELHATQTRKVSNVPYIAHLLAVAAIVLEHGGDEDEAIAALLHDAIEDQGGDATGQEIFRRFGDRVFEIVIGCTDAHSTPKPPWRERKEKHLAAMKSAMPSVCLVTAADKLHNAGSMIADFRRVGNSLWERFNGGRAGTLWYYRSMVEVLSHQGPPELVATLRRAVCELETLGATTANDR